jgi:hypothetical protein
MRADDLKERRNSLWVTVPPEVFEGLKEIVDSGAVIMADPDAVIEEALGQGFYDTADWIQSNPTTYGEGVFYGFKRGE